jgi:putative redox protein
MIVRARHLEGVKFELASGEKRLITDQLPQFGGNGGGPMPSELLLWSVAACFGQSILYVAARMRKSVEGLSLEIQGDKDTNAFRFSYVTIRVSSRCPVERLEKIVQTAKKYCYVTNSLSVPVHIEIATQA